jgi:hypothetical protein
MRAVSVFAVIGAYWCVCGHEMVVSPKRNALGEVLSIRQMVKTMAAMHFPRPDPLPGFSARRQVARGQAAFLAFARSLAEASASLVRSLSVCDSS